MKKIPPLKVVFPDEDKTEILKRIEECLSSGMLAQGKNVKEFEDEFAVYVGVKHAIAVNSGGSAIEISMRILDVKDKEVIVPTNTFLATASGVIFSGGKPVFVDVSPETFSLTLKDIKSAVSKNTAGVTLVHIGGIITPEIGDIRSWCQDNGLWLVEDCAHAHGSSFKNKMAGTFGCAGAYSFFATKVITSGEGGMIVTDNSDFAKKAKILRDYGKPEPWISNHTELGSNWRMSDITGAVGLVQLRRLNDFINWREKIAGVYTSLLQSSPDFKPLLPAGRCSWYKYIVLLQNGIDREKLKSRLKERGISLSGGVYEIPLHKQEVFKDKVNGNFPVANNICGNHICLPLFYGMSEDDVEFVVQGLKEVSDGLKNTSEIPGSIK